MLIFGGIIDVLQQYGARKQLEHTYKSVRYQKEKDGISVTDPSHYAARFAKFILGKFVDSSKGGAEPAAALPAADGAAPTAAPTPPPLESPRAEGRASPAL